MPERLFETRIVLSLMTGQMVADTKQEEVYALAGHMTGIPVTDDERLTAVRWVCDHSVRTHYETWLIASVPELGAGGGAIEVWLQSVENMSIKVHELLKVRPVREILYDDETAAAGSPIELFRRHPIVLWDLVTWLNQLDDEGFRRALIDRRSGYDLTLPFDKADDLLSSLAELPSELGDASPPVWVEKLYEYAYELMLAYEWTDEMLSSFGPQAQSGSWYLSLSPAILAGMLVRQRNLTDFVSVGNKMPGVFRRLTAAEDG